MELLANLVVGTFVFTIGAHLYKLTQIVKMTKKDEDGSVPVSPIYGALVYVVMSLGALLGVMVIIT